MAKKGYDMKASTVVEIGPGDSLGIGICSLLSGATKYFAFDLIKHTNIEKNLKVFDDLVERFLKDEPTAIKIRDTNSYHFINITPKDLITKNDLDVFFHPERLTSIKRAIKGENNPHGIEINYICPWDNLSVIPGGSVDLIISNAVLEHIDDLEFAYNAFRHWVKPGGWMSHGIDFACHGTANTWNGHWTYSKKEWNKIKNNYPYLINREPYSRHRKLLNKNGFKIVNEEVKTDTTGIKRKYLSDDYKKLSDFDLYTSGVFLQATRLI